MNLGLQEFVTERVVKPFAQGFAEERIQARKATPSSSEFESDPLLVQCARAFAEGVQEGNREGLPRIVTDIIALIAEMVRTVKKS